MLGLKDTAKRRYTNLGNAQAEFCKKCGKCAGIAILLAVDAAHERGVSLRTKIAALPTPARWTIYEVCIFVFLFMGRFLGGGSFLYARY